MATLLVFDGIKMGANITVNGQPVGIAVDQFLRYQYDVARFLKAGTNELSVTFDFDIDVNGRFMACTGGMHGLLAHIAGVQCILQAAGLQPVSLLSLIVRLGLGTLFRHQPKGLQHFLPGHLEERLPC